MNYIENIPSIIQLLFLCSPFRLCSNAIPTKPSSPNPKPYPGSIQATPAPYRR